MARVTSKRQVTIPKAIADHYGIEAGIEIEFVPAGDSIRVRPPQAGPVNADPASRIERFDRASERQRARQGAEQAGPTPKERGWRRDELYGRAGAG